MADEVLISNHLSARNGVFQYVRRVPEDLRAAFPFQRIQKSLRTRDQRVARSQALDLDRLWDERFSEARRQRGISVDPSGLATVSTAGWTWLDWEKLAEWFGASLMEEDWRARLSEMTGGTPGHEPELAHLPHRPNPIVKEHIILGRAPDTMSVATYAVERFSFVQRYVRRIGVALSRTEPSFERFMAEWLKAELAYPQVFRLRRPTSN